jgi:hypothetical protein
MTEIEQKVFDLLNFSSLKQPVDFKNTFAEVMINKINDVVSQRKMELAQNMLTHDYEEEAVEDVEEIEDQEEE